MTDKREDILARLLEVCASVDGVQKASRNINVISEVARPAIIIFDADEAAEEADPVGRPATAPRRIQMTPEIHVLLGDTPEAAGAAVNAMRAAIIKAVLTDAEIGVVVGGNGHIRYEGCISDFAEGKQLQAKMRLGFSFTYILKPSEL